MTATYDIYCGLFNETTADATLNPEHLRGFDGRIEFDTQAEADAVAAEFPKYVRAQAHRASEKFAVSLRVWFEADGVNKGTNETGHKRVKGFFKTCDRLGIPAVRENRAKNSTPKTPADYGWQ